MPKRKVAAKKTGGRKRGAGLYQSGSALRQSGNGFISSMLPGPMGALAKMVGLGRRPQRGRGQAWQNYVAPIYSGLAPVIARDVVAKAPWIAQGMPGEIAGFAHGQIQKLLGPR